MQRTDARTAARLAKVQVLLRLLDKAAWSRAGAPRVSVKGGIRSQVFDAVGRRAGRM